MQNGQKKKNLNFFLACPFARTRIREIEHLCVIRSFRNISLAAAESFSDFRLDDFHVQRLFLFSVHEAVS